MAAKVARGVAGLLLVLVGALAIFGKRATPNPEDNPLLSWIVAGLLGLVMLGGLASAVYEVADGIRHGRLDVGSLVTMVLLASFILFLLALWSWLAFFSPIE